MASFFKKTDRILGEFTAGAPVYSGKLHCKCIIWHDCPFFKRKRQDQQFIFAPETIKNAPAQIREKVSSINGIDGLFLSPNYIYRHNFLADRVGEADSNPLTKNQDRDIEKSYGIIPLNNLEFIGLADASLVRAFFTLDGQGKVVQSFSAEPGHQTWIDDGSLFINYTFAESELKAESQTDKETFKKSFYPVWGYYLHNAPPETNSSTGTSDTKKEDNFKHLPYQSKASPGDPVKILNDLNLASDAEFNTGKQNVFKNVNPGIHWKVIKRTPLFQGEDFWVELHAKAAESDIATTQNTKFQIRDGYEFLDVYHQIDADSGPDVGNEAVVELDANGNKVEDSLKQFDLTDQVYFIVEIGFLHPEHRYFLIITEKNAPIFCHAGRPIILQDVPSDQSGSTSSPPPQTSPGGEEDCGQSSSDNSDGTGGPTNNPPTTTPVQSQTTILRRLGRYDLANGKNLFKQEKLRITFRQHLGNMVITFSGHENDPWVISREDLVPTPTAGDSPDSTEDYQTQTVPIVIPNAKVSIMGGNMKCAFTFSPLNYKSLPSIPLDQRLSIQGPANFSDINLLLRDKGLSRDPNISSRPSRIQFSQDAEIYSEVIAGVDQRTRAMAVQDLKVKKYGKAPDMQTGRYVNKRNGSWIGVSARDCSRRVGSETPYVKVVEVSISLLPGTYIFEPATSQDAHDPWKLQDCITPIYTGFRLLVEPGDIAFESPGIDVSHHVMKISDSWTEEDMLRVTHSGKIEFLVNRGMDNRFSDGRINYADYLRTLADKNFYVQISVWWDEDGAMPTPLNMSDRIIFTGICSNASITEEVNKHIMSCDLSDYTKVLKDQMFFNSPFFDKMRDFNAISEILQMAGFRDDDSTQPGSLLFNLASGNDSGWFQTIHNGETVFNQEYALPGSYSILYEPAFKFKDGQPFLDGIQKIGQVAGKITYFDRLGVFHYEKLPYDQALFAVQSQPDFTAYDWERLSKIDFFTSPHDVNDADALETHRMAWDSYTVSRDMESVINEIRIISNTPDGELLIAGHTNFDSIFDIEKPGFLGYPKITLQMDGIFGDEANVKWYVKHLTKMFIPPVKVHFKALGHNKIKALDIVTFRGLGWRNKQVLIVGSVNSDIDAENNTWWQEFECYWIFPSQNIDWGQTNSISLGIDTPAQNG